MDRPLSDHEVPQATDVHLALPARGETMCGLSLREPVQTTETIRRVTCPSCRRGMAWTIRKSRPPV